MILLAIDTSGKEGGIALARAPEDTRNSSEISILDAVPLEGGTFSAQLVPQIAGLLAKHGLEKEAIGAFIVASGPGSFTGLRVGLAAIKALAEILGRPIAAVSRLEVVARAANHPGHIFAALDAGRAELYIGEYEVGTTVRCLQERLISREEFLAQAKKTIATPDATLAQDARRRGISVEQVSGVSVDAIARIGFEKVSQGVTVSPEDLEANYIRRSDAEIFSRK